MAALGRCKGALGTLNGIGQTLADPQLLLRPLQTREAIASSSIEGTYVTPEQLLLYELDPREPKRGDDQMADWLEVFSYSRPLQRGCEMLAELPICNRIILEMHRILMQGSREQQNLPGQFRNWQVQIGSSGRFIPSPPTHLTELMGDLEKYINSKGHHCDPLIRCFLVHYQFEAIHPFRDGNGRVGQSTPWLMIYKWLGHSMPWLYLSAFFERYKDEYIDNLFRVSTEGAWSKWIEFGLRHDSQANDSVARCHTFHALHAQFHAKLTSPTPRTHTLIDSLFINPVVNVTTVAAKFGVAYQTARTDIDRLCEAGILMETQNSQPKSFYAPEIIRAAYIENT